MCATELISATFIKKPLVHLHSSRARILHLHKYKLVFVKFDETQMTRPGQVFVNRIERCLHKSKLSQAKTVLYL